MSSSLRERDKEREQHKRDEAVQHFKALLADLVMEKLIGARQGNQINKLNLRVIFWLRLS